MRKSKRGERKTESLWERESVSKQMMRRFRLQGKRIKNVEERERERESKRLRRREKDCVKKEKDGKRLKRNQKKKTGKVGGRKREGIRVRKIKRLKWKKKREKKGLWESV